MPLSLPGNDCWSIKIRKNERNMSLPCHPRGLSQQPFAAATINLPPQAFGFPQAHVTVNSNLEILPNHIYLYKDKALENCATPNPLIDDDGNNLLRPLVTYRDGDLNCLTAGFYWSPEKEEAEEYFQYAARRCPLAITCIIRNQVPQSFIDSLRMEELWYSLEWKEYVWTYKKCVLSRTNSITLRKLTSSKATPAVEIVLI
ncbi:hypothetical protein DPV78_007444 [Talaromyces pinophilus]|nr:hypothetical protein DPV78_007444 [Talaromyces pinophilus]